MNVIRMLTRVHGTPRSLCRFGLGRPGRLGVALAVSLTVAALLSGGAIAASHGVRFSPRATYPLGAVQLSVSTKLRSGQRLHIYLAGKRKASPGADLRMGELHSASGTLHVPKRTPPGRYYVLACRKGGERRCLVSSRRLQVLARRRTKAKSKGGSGGGGSGGSSGSGGAGGSTGGGSGLGDGDYKYVVKYSHADEASYTRQENSTFFIGTDTFHQQFGLSSDIDLSGNPLTAKATGTGPLAYTDAAYHSEQDGSFQSQGGVAGSPGACDGSSKVDLVGTTDGTATVVGLNITQTQITLDFRPGEFPYNVNPGGPPNERYHYVDTLNPCPGSDSTENQPIFLNTFQNFYYVREDSDPGVKLVGMGTSNEYVELSGGWQRAGADQPNVVATLTVSGSWNPGDPNSTYTDRWEIDRVPDQG